MIGGLKARIAIDNARCFLSCNLEATTKSKGFTLIEVLIVLAVTGLIFVGAAVMIAGKQNRTQFDQAIRQVQFQIQQVINEVAIGFYPNKDSFTCMAGVGGPVLTSAGGGQSTNEGCVFLGKVIQLNANVGSTGAEQFRVYTVAGLQKNSSGREITSYGEAVPTAVAPTSAAASTPDATEVDSLLYGLSTHEAYYGVVKTNIGAIGFASSLASYSGGTIVSGSQQVNVIPINNSNLNSTPEQMAQDINNYFATSPVNPTEGPKICFVSGGTDQSGLITIGNSGRQLSVTLDIKSNKTCS